MALLEKWQKMAYNETEDKNKLQKLWADYFEVEKGIYKKLLAEPDTVVTGTVEELAEKYGTDIMTMTGFLDGINDSLVKPNPIEKMTEKTKVTIDFDNERLYKNMVAAGADWLYGLEEWNAIFDADKQKELYKEQKQSQTVRNEGPKVGRNDPCPCGSGKKYKKCCGARA